MRTDALGEKKVLTGYEKKQDTASLNLTIPKLVTYTQNDLQGPVFF